MNSLPPAVVALLNALFEFLAYLVVGVVLFLLLYYVGSRVLEWIIWHFVRYRARLRREPLNPRRVETLHHLIISLTQALSVILTLIFLLAQHVDASALATTIGLFSAGLGIAARPFISDVLGGIILLLEDQFAIGEKVEIGDRNVIGVVEEVSLRTVHIRGDQGELWIVPNGDVRTIRNFTRGSFSPANLRVVVPTGYLDEVLAILQTIAETPGPHVLETPEIISEQGLLGEKTELMLRVKAQYGYGSQVRRALLARLQEALTAQGVIAQAQADTSEPIHPPSERPKELEDQL